MSKSAAIATYRRFPKELFRVNSGWRITLRPRMRKLPFYYDIATDYQDGTRLRHTKVLPKALNPPDYEPPNGAQLRPNTAYTQHYITHEYKGKDVVVYSVQEGTELPDDLILVHEGPGREEWSLQPAKEMTLEEFNRSITKFLLHNGALMTREQWSRAYPKPTEPRSPHFPLPKNWRARSTPPRKPSQSG